MLVGNNYTGDHNNLYKIACMRKALQDGATLAEELQVSKIMLAGDWNMTPDLVAVALQSIGRGEWEVSNAASIHAFIVANSEIRHSPLADPILAWERGHTPQVAQMPLRQRGAGSVREASAFSSSEAKVREEAIGILEWLQERRARELHQTLQKQLAKDDEAARLQERVSALLEQKRNVEESIGRWVERMSMMDDGRASASSRDHLMTQEEELLALGADLLDQMAEHCRKWAAERERILAVKTELDAARGAFLREWMQIGQYEWSTIDTVKRQRVAEWARRCRLRDQSASQAAEAVLAEAKRRRVEAESFDECKLGAELVRKKLRLLQELRLAETAMMQDQLADEASWGSAMALSDFRRVSPHTAPSCRPMPSQASHHADPCRPMPAHRSASAPTSCLPHAH